MGSDLERLLVWQVKAAGLPDPAPEYRFDPGRRWRFDLAWPVVRLACECEGATWTGGRHTTGSGFERDCEKYNQAAIMGWRVLRFTGGMIESGAALESIVKALGA
jgi:hypothetical protein